MSRLWFSLSAIALAVIALGLLIDGFRVSAAPGPEPVLRVEDGPLMRREAQSVGEQPAISFIDSPSAMCYQAGVAECYIRWNYLYVTAGTSQYIISMSLSINNRLRAYHTGFFQTTMYIPSDQLGPGFKVACGRRGAGGNLLLGNAYAYTVRARETGGLSAANYGTVYCPADRSTVQLPLVRR